MIPKFVAEIVCMPISITAVTMYVVLVGIDNTARNIFGELWSVGTL